MKLVLYWSEQQKFGKETECRPSRWNSAEQDLTIFYHYSWTIVKCAETHLNWKFCNTLVEKFLFNLGFYWAKIYIRLMGYRSSDWGYFSVYHNIHTGSGYHPVTYQIGTGGTFHGDKTARMWSWPITSI